MRTGAKFPSTRNLDKPEGRLTNNTPDDARHDNSGPDECERPNPPRMSTAIRTAIPGDRGSISVPSLSHTEPDLVLPRPGQATSASPVDIEPTELTPGVYIGEGRAKSGEKFYLRMERVDASNYLFWRLYVDATNKFIDSGRGLLKRLMHFTRSVEGVGGEKQFVNENYSAFASEVGMNAEEFQQLVDMLGQGGYCAGPDRRKRGAMLQVGDGSGHLYLGLDGSTYVTFASRCREISTTGLATTSDACTAAEMTKSNDALSQPGEFRGVSATVIKNSLDRDADDASRRISLKDYFSLYGDVLMCVGSQFGHGKSWYSNRGIFRNPYSVIKNDYKGIAMVLHEFSGAVAKKFFPERTEMIVKPIASMQLIICETLRRDDYHIDNEADIDRLARLCRESCDAGDGFEAPDNYIKTEALARLYRTHASN